jgi:predicted O-methyltransferase YrrM
MYRGEAQAMPDGKSQELVHLASGLSPEKGLWLYEEYRRLAPRASLETGMAYGFSTIYLLAAIAKNGTGNHIAVDRFENSYFASIGVENVRRLGQAEHFRLIEDSSVQAAAALEKEKQTFDFIFIDDGHLFDLVCLDFTVFAPLLNKGGWIVFDDLWMPSVRTAVNFIQTNRPDFREISALWPLAAFERIGEDRRLWDHFVPFASARKFPG